MTLLADLTGIPQTVIQRPCSAHRHTLSADNFQQPADHFGIRTTKPRRGLKPPHWQQEITLGEIF